MDYHQVWNVILLKMNAFLNAYSSFSNVYELIILLIIVFFIINLLFSFEKKQNIVAQKQIAF